MAIRGIVATVVAQTRDFTGSKIDSEVSRNRADEEIVRMAVSYMRRSEVVVCASIRGRQVQSCR